MNHKFLLATFCISLMVLSLPLALAEPSHATNGSFNVTVSHPSSVYKTERFQLFFNESKGFSNYTATVYIAAEYAIGLSSGGNTQELSKSGFFEFNITAPDAANQSIYITIYATATYGSVVVSKIINIAIPVYEPITLNAYISNTESTTYSNISVQFILNGALISTKVISLGPGQSKDVTVIEASSLLNSGVNTLQVKILNGSLFTGVKSSYVSTFYYGTPPNYDWIYYISGAVVIFMAFLVLASGKRKTATGQPKWRYNRKKNQKKS